MITSCPKLFSSYTSAVAGGNLAAIVGNVAESTRLAKQNIEAVTVPCTLVYDHIKFV